MASTRTFSAASTHHDDAAGEPAGSVDKKSLRRIVFASVVGNALEWYDFFLYSTAAALVFGGLFFPKGHGPASSSTLAAFAGFAVGFRGAAVRRRAVRPYR